MDLINQNDNIERITGLYTISNTPRFLYSKLREDIFVQDIAKRMSEEDIMREIIERGKVGIRSIQELALMYAMYISLTFKNYKKVEIFYNNDGKINFEWFADFRTIYFATYRHTNYFEISGTPNKIVEQMNHLDTKQFNNTIELNP